MKSTLTHITLSAVISILISVSCQAQLAGLPGAFSRMGLGARGMGMGNAMTAVASGDLTGYYNPALAALQEQHTGALSYGVLTLDRSFNTLFYTQSLPPSAGLSLGIINSGVKNIDGRDGDGYHTENYSTSENEFLLSFALRPSKKLSVGVSTKIYYYHLFDKINSSAFGLDFGFLWKPNDRWSVGGSVRDAIAAYKWDTSDLYGQSGNSSKERFPLLRTLGVAYRGDAFLLSAETELTNEQTTLFRAGGEWIAIDELTLRAGLDHWNTSRKEEASPTFGLSVRLPLQGWEPRFDYAYASEPFALSAIHTISFSVRF
ncbi:MAG: hypothetical protein NTV54_03595 [Ignavibacteriales bacterium]|nr:hypothetical protein [Ignavibacteriales bacterium]